jgi:hypothetical protein
MEKKMRTIMASILCMILTGGCTSIGMESKQYTNGSETIVKAKPIEFKLIENK